MDRDVVEYECYSSGLRRRSDCWFVGLFNKICSEIPSQDWGPGGGYSLKQSETTKEMSISKGGDEVKSEIVRYLRPPPKIPYDYRFKIIDTCPIAKPWHTSLIEKVLYMYMRI